MGKPKADWPDLPEDPETSEGDGEDAGVPLDLLLLHADLEDAGVTPSDFKAYAASVDPEIASEG